MVIKLRGAAPVAVVAQKAQRWGCLAVLPGTVVCTAVRLAGKKSGRVGGNLPDIQMRCNISDEKAELLNLNVCI